MTVFAIKLIALVTMIIDHGTEVLYKNVPFLLSHYWLLRSIGRVAFPLYCFLLVNGFRHTRDRSKYFLRLLAFAVISQIPFVLAFEDMSAPFSYLNIFFTLAAGFAVMCLAQPVREGKQPAGRKEGLLWLLAAALLFAYVTRIQEKADYGTMGLVLIFTLWLCPNNRFLHAAVILVWSWAEYYFMMKGSPTIRMELAVYASVSVLPVLLYNGKPGPKLKMAFYAAYPVHLLLFALIHAVM